MESIRFRFRFFGRVQGVGFRYRAVHAAQALRLTGWVHNCWDGTVEMEVQGREREIWEMIAMIRRGTYIEVQDYRVRQIPLESGERDFCVRHG